MRRRVAENREQSVTQIVRHPTTELSDGLGAMAAALIDCRLKVFGLELHRSRSGNDELTGQDRHLPTLGRAALLRLGARVARRKRHRLNHPFLLDGRPDEAKALSRQRADQSL